MIHESKALSKVVVPAPKVHILADDTEMELIALTDSRTSLHRPRVLFTACGGLEQTALLLNEKEVPTVVLEKACVVGY